MFASQILLLLFLGNWIFSQYNEQKSILVKDLERGLFDSEKQVLDSMMSKYIINPIIDEVQSCTIKLDEDYTVTKPSSKIKITTEIKNIDSEKYIVEAGKEFSKANKNSTKKYISKTEPYKVYNTSSKSEIHFDTIKVINKSEKDKKDKMLYQGVKIFINKIGGKTMTSYYENDINDSSSETSSSLKADTILLKNIFSDFINKNSYNFSLNRIPINDTISKNKNLNKIYLNCNSLDDSIGFEISDFQFFLFKKISPQILFALLLLLLTSIAFRLSYISIKKQKQLLTIKNDFISNISHELKTPVSTVKVALEALLDFDMKKNPEVVNEYLEMSLTEMNRLDILVNKVLNTSALEDGNQFIYPETINIYELISEVIYSMQLRFNQLQAEVKFDSDNNECVAMIDKIHIQGVLINLIDNSLKYSNEKPYININLSENENEIKLVISDKGNGIPNEYLNKVFDKFFRVPTGDKHNVKGYGLGLNYAALVMKHHKGKIEVKNLIDGGCAFTLTFPKSI